MSWANPNIAFGAVPGTYTKNKRLAIIRRLQERKLRQQALVERLRMEADIDELDGDLDDE